MSATRTISTQTLGAELERDRLERRVSRVTFAIAALRKRAGAQRSEPAAPARHLRHAIADFEAQLEAMNARLRELAPGPGSTQARAWSGVR
jgi:hypothetical protein